MIKKYFFLGLLIAQTLVSSAQTIYSGQVIDVYTKNPLAGAEVTFQQLNQSVITNDLGFFNLVIDNPGNDSTKRCFLKEIGNQVAFFSDIPFSYAVYNMLGQSTGLSGDKIIGNGMLPIERLSGGLYIIELRSESVHNVYKLLLTRNSAYVQLTRGKEYGSYNGSFIDSILIRHDGYYSQSYPYVNNLKQYQLLQKGYNNIDYLDNLLRFEAFDMLKGQPLSNSFGEVSSVKVIYSINDDRIYYANSEKYAAHYYFCADVLGYTKGHLTFNQTEYTHNANRSYILSSINHFKASDTYALEFWVDDELTCEEIEKVYRKIETSSFIGKKLKLYVNQKDIEVCTQIPIITNEELYAGQNYQALNPQENFGYLKKVSSDKLDETYLGRHDIVLINSIPIDISVVAGIITTEFQTPLSHINVLSHNRGTPNMALRDGWTNERLAELENKLVYLNVSLDSFYIREANLEEAQAFWAQKEPQTIHHLQLDTITSGLIELNDAGLQSVEQIGGKAANFAELTRVDVPKYGPLPVPEDHFAIPFYYYWQHLKKYGLDHYIDEMLKDQAFLTNAQVRSEKLKILRDSIKNSPVDPELIKLVKAHLSSSEVYTDFRFRSSTNAEDIEGFNGAGLYESYTGSLTNPDRPVDKAIKKVWASLWFYEAFEERDYFKIDHKTIAMGILVHRSYPAEAANGVVITKNLYSIYNPAYTINVQYGELSIVNPDEGLFPDQIIFYTYSDDVIYDYINHSNVPGMEGQTVMTDDELNTLRFYCKAIQNHYQTSKPLDIEFKVDLVDGKRKIYVKQARFY